MFVLAIDQSTAGTKATLFDPDGAIQGRHDVPHRQITNDLGWVEHDPDEIYRNTLAACRQVIAHTKISKEQINAIAISNQRETAVCWNRKTGLPVYNAIVWQCGRASDITDELEKIGAATLIRQKTGLHLSPFFSAAKFAWIIRNVDQAPGLLDNGQLCCGNIDAWLLFRMTEGRSFKTDFSNASRTQLLDLDTLDWSDEVLELFGLNRKALPEVGMSDRLFGETLLDGLFDKPVPILAMMGDSHAALFANNCLQPYMAKATFGTGTSVMMNIGTERRKPKGDSVVESLAWGMNGQVSYVLEGNINYSGAIIRWLVDEIGLLDKPGDAGKLAASTAGTNGVYLVPAFSGLGAPYWDPQARAAIVGMSRATRREHIIRAAEEAIAYQIRDIVEELNASCPEPLSRLAVDGGATRDAFLMQFVADQLGVTLNVSRTEELSAAGVAYMAGIRCGLCDPDCLFAGDRHRKIEPKMDLEERQDLYDGWKKAIRQIRSC